MSLDRSLRRKNALVRHRNVLTRAERVTTMKTEERWSDEQSVFGLPKVAHRKAEAKKGGKAKGPEEAAAGTETAAAAAPAAPAAKPAAKAEKK